MWNEPTEVNPPASPLPPQFDSEFRPSPHGECLNCGTPLSGTLSLEFCARCGQRSGKPHLSVRDLGRELVAEHFGLDTKIGRTLVMLLRHPGQLTNEFIAGRRVRYVPPLRLYLTLSVIFFLASAFKTHVTGSKEIAGGLVNIRRGPADSIGGRATGVRSDSAIPAGAMDTPFADTTHGNALTLFFKRRFTQRIGYVRSHQQDAFQQISESFSHELPDALFLLVPGLALALAILYHRSGRFYVEHLVFAFHIQAFSFAALTVGLIPIPFLSTLIGCSIIVYLFLALGNVYGGSRLATIGKACVILVGYGISLTLVMAVVGLGAFLFS